MKRPISLGTVLGPRTRTLPSRLRISGSAARPALIALAICLAMTTLSAQFHPSVQVTDGAGTHEPPRIVRIAGEHVAIASATSGTIVHGNTASGFPTTPQIVTAQQQGGVSLAPAAGFLQVLAHTQVEGSGGPTERDIYLASNGGGQFTSLGAVTNDDFDDRDPWIHFDATGEQHLAWVSIPAAGEAAVRYRKDDEAIIDLADGDFPQIVPLGGGDVLVLYLRLGDLLGRRVTLSGAQPEELVVDAVDPISAYRAHGDATALHVLTVEAGALVHRSAAPAGPLGAPATLHPGPVDGRPALDVDPEGNAAAAWVSTGEIFHSEQVAGSFPAGTAIGAELSPSDPDLVVDGLGYARIAYLSGGAVWLTNDAPPPTADFMLALVDGNVLPVEVAFTNASSGFIQSQTWDFGDGETSNQLAPNHVYVDPGSFPVSLTVRGPGGEDTFTMNNALSTVLPPNVIGMADIIAFGGQPVSHPILATHPDPLQGYQVALRYDEAVTPFTEVNFDGTGVDSLQPEFLITNIFPNGVESDLIIAVVFDFNAPFDGRTLDPGLDQTVANLLYTVPFGNPLGTVGTIEFIDGLGTPPITNRFATSSNGSVTPYMMHGSCTISAQPQFIFQRGDANFNLSVDISDAIYMLSFLFTGGTPPECPDSADSNDDGQLNIGDAIYTLSFLFSAGPTIPYPFPGFGIDPTEDNLGICNPSP